MSDRAARRDVHIFDPKDPNTVLGGLTITKGITNTNFYSMVGIIFIFTSDYHLRRGHRSGPIIKKDDRPLQAGNYFIIAAAGSFAMNTEPWMIRSDSLLSTRPPTAEFIDAVRNRDRGCIISGRRPNNLQLERGYWGGFQVAPIFPLSHEDYWAAHNPPVSIDSPQNGILLRSDIRSHFESYTVSINPDDNYKIVFFLEVDDYGIAGTHLSNLKTFLADPQRPLEELLRLHYRHAVLANVRGQGEPFFDCDFPPDPHVAANQLQDKGHF